ncbi:MAG: hypothetical protein JEY99_09070 [Spirochaetales bacterium]|nr:hypothetical protein [Spirochaetales bacterium]
MIIQAIETSITREDANKIVGRVSAGFIPQVQKLIYYPYFWVHFEYEVKTILGKRKVDAYTLVDLLENQASTADRFETIEVEEDNENILDPDVDLDSAMKTAQTYLVHSAVHEAKSLIFPKSEVKKSLVMYKPFWIVRCENSKKERFRVIVDTVTGKFEILNIEEQVVYE